MLGSNGSTNRQMNLIFFLLNTNFIYFNNILDARIAYLQELIQIDRKKNGKNAKLHKNWEGWKNRVESFRI